MKKNIEEALLSLSQKPIFATSVERFKIMNDIKSQDKDLPQPKRFSKLLRVFLSRVSTPIEKFDIIAGRCVDRELTEDEEIEFSAYLKHPDYPSRKLFFASGHCTYSWEMLVEEGIVGLKERVLGKLLSEKDIRAYKQTCRAACDHRHKGCDDDVDGSLFGHQLAELSADDTAYICADRAACNTADGGRACGGEYYQTVALKTPGNSYADSRAVDLRAFEGCGDVGEHLQT